MREVRRYALAGAAAAAASAIVFPAYLFVVGLFRDPAGPLNSLGVAGLVFAYALVVTTGHVVMFGIPIIVLLQRRGAFGPRNMAIGGALAGAVPALTTGLSFVLYGGALGALGALVFWEVWTRTEPAPATTTVP